MAEDKREHRRIPVRGLNTNVTLTNPNGSIIIAKAKILNISRSGIRVWLEKPISAHITEAIELEIILPKSGLPFVITANIVHCKSGGEFGAFYVDLRTEDPIDQLLDECDELK